jgi:hypothetical protein
MREVATRFFDKLKKGDMAIADSGAGSHILNFMDRPPSDKAAKFLAAKLSDENRFVRFVVPRSWFPLTSGGQQ